jgi:sugar phosphate isomerase/epimerase
MRFGYCTGFEHAPEIALAGFDYLEPPLAPLLKPESPEPEVMPALLEAASSQAIHAEAFNVFLPGDLKITGSAVDPARQQRYLDNAFQRVKSLGGKIVVFGSAGARGVPDGFAREEAVRQIAAFLILAGPLAAANGVTVAIEPLSSRECNILTSVAEAMEMVQAVAHPAVQVLADLYHIDTDGRSYDETRAAGSALRHVHIAGCEGRRAPIPADIDYMARFFGVLKTMGYDRRISVEASATDIERDAPVALEACRKAWELA